ncbi:MAG TPA: CoB--CoM heterodisulfide reductase iron-sulfur subunit B family protein [Anaeromyxobacteraceae bacterium]|nr:CoB--CoM heterodisulfide reductase iron-sulfur subunit B family protein [Anaeromyxobacteraceae bacterium]
MRFAYYPGCSLSAIGRAYDESARAVCKHLGIELDELEDWNCCGATAFMCVNELLGLSISARNLCIAQRMALDLVVPCPACFTNLRKTDRALRDRPQARRQVAEVLAAGKLSYLPGTVPVRHLLEALLMDEGLGRIRSAVRIPLRGLAVAPYYGCQVVRPPVDFDESEYPTMLDGLLTSLGAEVVHYPLKSRCCGAALMGTSERTALHLCKELLHCAQQNGALLIATLCPLCQTNLDAFQSSVNRAFGTSFHIPVLYFTQLMGIAMGLPGPCLGLGREIVSAAPLLGESMTHRCGSRVPQEG